MAETEVGTIQDYDPTVKVEEVAGIESAPVGDEKPQAPPALNPMNFKRGVLLLHSKWKGLVIEAVTPHITIIDTIEGAVPIRHKKEEVVFENNRAQVKELLVAQGLLEKEWIESAPTCHVEAACLPGDLAKNWSRLGKQNRLRVISALVEGHSAKAAGELIDWSLEEASREAKTTKANECQYCGECTKGPNAREAMIAHVAVAHPEAATG